MTIRGLATPIRTRLASLCSANIVFSASASVSTSTTSPSRTTPGRERDRRGAFHRDSPGSALYSSDVPGFDVESDNVLTRVSHG